MSKANRQGQSSCSGNWRFFVLNYFVWLFSYLVSKFCLIYHFFVFAFLSSGVLFLWPRPPHYNIPPIWSQHRLTLFPDNANNSSMELVMSVRTAQMVFLSALHFNRETLKPSSTILWKPQM
jgi:hypothetical protein